jgi:hypothetical protein
VVRTQSAKDRGQIAKLSGLLHKQISLAGIIFSALIYINAKSQRIACQQCG